MSLPSVPPSAISNDIGDIEKDMYSLRSSAASPPALDPGPVPVKGIDAEVAEFFENTPDVEVVIDEKTNKRLRMMVHKRVLVIMVATYFLQALDKGTINFASIMGIIEDTHLVGSQYSWLTTCGGYFNLYF